MVDIILLKNPYEYSSIFSIADPVLMSVKHLYKNKYQKWKWLPSTCEFVEEVEEKELLL